jgi:hypothetical protein
MPSTPRPTGEEGSFAGGAVYVDLGLLLRAAVGGEEAKWPVATGRAGR